MDQKRNWNNFKSRDPSSYFNPLSKNTRVKSRDIQLKFFVYFMNQAIGVDKFRKHVVMLNCTYAFNFFEFGKFIRKMGYF